MATNRSDPSCERRGFLKAMAGVPFALAGLAGGVGYKAARAAEAPAEAGPNELSNRGYHETAHIRRYYASARR
ncbi:MAG TPA: formate dehydrogenase [Gammaproteobacteria bacterium]|nr:formate dehydrogenase [Gammaproteobacteria bacterium]